MSNDIIPTPPGPQTPRQIVPAELSERLDTDWSYGPHVPAVKAALQAKIDQLSPWSRPVPPEVVRAWIKPLIAGIRPDLKADQMEKWFEALMIGVGHLEVGGFNPETQRDLIARSRYWPTPADIYDVVVSASVRIRNDMNGLRRALAAPTKATEA